MGILYVMSGVPCSGKTTFVKNHFFNSDSLWYVSRDQIRFSLLKDGEDYFTHEDEVFKEFTNEISGHLLDFDVIADATHLNINSRRKLFKSINTNLADRIIGINILPPKEGIEELIKRNNKREGREKLPQDALVRMYNRYQPINIDEWPFFNEVWNVRTK